MKRGKYRPDYAEKAQKQAWGDIVADEVLERQRHSVCKAGARCNACGDFQPFPLPTLDGKPVALCQKCASAPPPKAEKVNPMQIPTAEQLNADPDGDFTAPIEQFDIQNPPEQFKQPHRKGQNP